MRWISILLFTAARCILHLLTVCYSWLGCFVCGSQKIDHFESITIANAIYIHAITYTSQCMGRLYSVLPFCTNDSIRVFWITHSWMMAKCEGDFLFDSTHMFGIQSTPRHEKRFANIELLSLAVYIHTRYTCMHCGYTRRAEKPRTPSIRNTNRQNWQPSGWSDTIMSGRRIFLRQNCVVGVADGGGWGGFSTMAAYSTTHEYPDSSTTATRVEKSGESLRMIPQNARSVQELHMKFTTCTRNSLHDFHPGSYFFAMRHEHIHRFRDTKLYCIF